MRWLTILLALLLGTFATRGEGTVHFTTRLGTLVNAPVTYLDGGPVIGTGPGAVLGQLYGGPVGGPLVPIGIPLPFRSDAGAGYISSGGSVTIPNTTRGGAANVKLVAWLAGTGNTYAEAVANGRGGGHGESDVITVDVLGGGTSPPARLRGLEGFSIPPPGRESSPLNLPIVVGVILLLLGVSLPLILRRRRRVGVA